MRLGLVNGAHYVSETEQQDQVRTKALLLYWAHSKAPIEGICVYRAAEAFMLHAPSYVCFWHSEHCSTD